MKKTIRKLRRSAARTISVVPVAVIVGAPVLTYFIVRMVLQK
ncbi:hypothetical protein ACFSVM_02795 [Paenibacillus shunpengii]|uniref:Uncharacterized protein n=1 Tax=Paenibacillus shunpengii TaxID=2054424 RepID=A0ABW5SJQ7_9BACL